ncbi:transmembrane protein 40 isoform X2 [Ambystoma mexicanum]
MNKRRGSAAMLKRTLTKVKEIDSDDEHPFMPGGDQEDLKRRNAELKKTEDGTKEGPMRKDVDSRHSEEADSEDARKEDVDSGDTEEGDQEDASRKDVDSKHTEDADEKIVPYDTHRELVQRGKKKKLPVTLSEQESEDHHHDHRGHRGGWMIRKDDEFFHFILACFSIGAVLVCYHNYADWTISAGVGLLIFASLETIGIYFGFVTRIRAVLEGFLPLFQRSALPGFTKRK